MSRRRAERVSKVLWQYDWHQPGPDQWPDWAYDRSFRVIGWYWPEDNGKLGQIHYEELSEDCLGNPIWINAEDEIGICRPVVVKLLKLAGIVPEDEDTGDLE